MVAGTREELGRRPSIVAIVVACVGLLLGIGGVLALRGFDKPVQLLTPDQTRHLTRVGTWRDKSGAEIKFTAWDNDPYTGGSFTFVNVPNIFDYRTVPNPPSNGHGYWTVGDGTDGTVCFVFQGGGWPAGEEPKVSLRVEGSPSAPILLCRYPDPSDSCTFTKQ